MTQQEQGQSAITDEMRASIGREGPPSRHEMDKTAIRMFARAVGHTDPIYYDEEYAKSKGYRSLVAPPAFLGTPVFNPRGAGAGGMAAMAAAMGAGAGAGGRPRRVLDGGAEHEYTGVPICAGDVLTAVSKTVSIEETQSRLGTMLITRRETSYTNEDGEVVARVYRTSLQY
jgi:acyl dehydratase